MMLAFCVAGVHCHFNMVRAVSKSSKARMLLTGLDVIYKLCLVAGI